MTGPQDRSDGLTPDLGRYVSRLENAVYKGIASEATPYDLSPLDVYLLMICMEMRECTATQLAVQLPVDASRISRLVTVPGRPRTAAQATAAQRQAHRHAAAVSGWPGGDLRAHRAHAVVLRQAHRGPERAGDAHVRGDRPEDSRQLRGDAGVLTALPSFPRTRESIPSPVVGEG